MNENEKITVAVAGFGLRARDYTKFCAQNSDKMQVVAFAEINQERKKWAQDKFHIPDSLCFNTVKEMLQMPKLADLLIISTQDQQHVAMAKEALKAGYDILLEKPISPDLHECLELREEAHKYNRIITVCHVMRYTIFYQQIKKAIASGIIGEIRSLQAAENVGYFHQVHSFVRGNWRRSEDASPMILAKSCHDMDLIAWLIDKKCERISSFGSLSYFKKECAPKGAAERCLDGCKVKESCPYDCEKIYVYNDPTGIVGGSWIWPCSAITDNRTVDGVYQALREGPYGRCVFHCDNNVVDHQIVNMEFEGGVTAAFTMCAFTNSDGREIKIMGTMGDIIGSIDTHMVKIQPFGKEPVIIDTAKMADDLNGLDGHEGGDMALMKALYELMAEKKAGKSVTSLTSIDQSVESHVMALAAEYSRTHKGKTVNLKEFEIKE